MVPGDYKTILGLFFDGCDNEDERSLFSEYRYRTEKSAWVCVFQYSRLDERILSVPLVRIKTGNGNLQTVVVERNLIPPQSMQL